MCMNPQCMFIISCCMCVISHCVFMNLHCIWFHAVYVWSHDVVVLVHASYVWCHLNMWFHTACLLGRMPCHHNANDRVCSTINQESDFTHAVGLLLNYIMHHLLRCNCKHFQRMSYTLPVIYYDVTAMTSAGYHIYCPWCRQPQVDCFHYVYSVWYLMVYE